jgi:hypothetical protein
VPGPAVRADRHPLGLRHGGQADGQAVRSITSPADSGADAASVGENPDLAADTGKKGPTAYFGNLGQNQVRRVDQFVNSINADDPQPTLYFLHVLLPHTP